jgi:hypothetical protein
MSENVLTISSDEFSSMLLAALKYVGSETDAYVDNVNGCAVVLDGMFDLNKVSLHILSAIDARFADEQS